MGEQKIEQGQQPPGQVPPAQQAPAATPPAAQQPPAPLNVPPPPPAPQAAPEEISVTFPKDAVVDPEVAKKFKSIVADPKLTPSQRAQALVDLQWQSAQAAEKARYDAYNASVSQWRSNNEKSLRADPDFGKDFEANKAIAQRPLATYGDPELARELAAMGLENHPRLTKFLHKIGQAMGEAKTPVKNPVPGVVSDEQEALYQRYPTMRPKAP